MDEYLRSRYKKAEGGGMAHPPKPASGRYAPPPERLHRQAARPMFPVNSRPRPAAEPPKPASLQHPQPPPASHNEIPAPRQQAAGRPASPKRRFGFVKIAKVLTILLIIAGMAVGGGYYYLAYVRPPSPLPQSLAGSAGFPIYYPGKQIASYKYQPGSANNQNGLFFYKLADGSNGAVISEQTRPSTNFNPSGLPNFKSITVGGGTAVIGVSSGVLTVVYITPTTLINMTAVNNITRGDMILIAQNLAAVKRKTGLLQVFNIDFIRSGIVMERAIYKNQ